PPEGFAPGVDVRLARQVIERMALDGVNERTGMARGGDEVVPAAGRHLAAIDSRQRPSNGIRSVEVVEQPAVEPVFAQRRLHCANVERHDFQYRSFVTGTTVGMSRAS